MTNSSFVYYVILLLCIFVMSCTFFSFVFVYLYVFLCTLTWKNDYAKYYEFKQNINHSINKIGHVLY